MANGFKLPCCKVLEHFTVYVVCCLFHISSEKNVLFRFEFPLNLIEFAFGERLASWKVCLLKEKCKKNDQYHDTKKTKNRLNNHNMKIIKFIQFFNTTVMVENKYSFFQFNLKKFGKSETIQ